MNCSALLLPIGGRALPGPRPVDARHAQPHAPTQRRACQLGARPVVAGARSMHCSSRTSRRVAVLCRAAAKNFYDLLGVPQSASDRDIKSAYRKLAMKLHPDVNKAPDAQKRFMEVKVAYETLSDAKQRAEYDRRLRMGGFGGSGTRAGAGYGASSSGGFGSTSRGPYGPYGAGPSYTQEPVPGLDDLIRELEKEYTAWVNQSSKDAKSKSLLEELEDLGGELLDFLEESLGIKDEQPAASSSSGSRKAGDDGSRDARSAAERFDAYWQQYGDGKVPGASSDKAAEGSSSSTSNTTRTNTSSSSSPYSTGAQQPTPKRSSDDDIEAELLALKKKLNKM